MLNKVSFSLVLMAVCVGLEVSAAPGIPTSVVGIADIIASGVGSVAKTIAETILKTADLVIPSVVNNAANGVEGTISDTTGLGQKVVSTAGNVANTAEGIADQVARGFQKAFADFLEGLGNGFGVVHNATSSK